MAGGALHEGAGAPRELDWRDSGLEKINEDEFSDEASDPYRKPNKSSIKKNDALSQSLAYFKHSSSKIAPTYDRPNYRRNSQKHSDTDHLSRLFSNVNRYPDPQISRAAPGRYISSPSANRSERSSDTRFVNYQMNFDEFNRLVSNPQFTDPRDEMEFSEQPFYSVYSRNRIDSRNSVSREGSMPMRSPSPMIEYIQNERRMLSELKNSKLQSQVERAKSPPKYVLVPISDYVSTQRSQLVPIAPGIVSTNVVKSELVENRNSNNGPIWFESSLTKDHVSEQKSRHQKLLRQLSGSSIAAHSITSLKSGFKQRDHDCLECGHKKDDRRTNRHRETASFSQKSVGSVGNPAFMRSSEVLHRTQFTESKAGTAEVSIRLI